MLKYPLHDSFRDYMARLSHLYLNHPALWKHDYERIGFEWKEADMINECIYAYYRKSEEETIFTILNLSGAPKRYTLSKMQGKQLELLLDSDDETFSGSSKVLPLLNPDDNGAIFMDLPACSGRMYLVKDVKKEAPKKKRGRPAKNAQ